MHKGGGKICLYESTIHTHNPIAIRSSFIHLSLIVRVVIIDLSREYVITLSGESFKAQIYKLLRYTIDKQLFTVFHFSSIDTTAIDTERIIGGNETRVGGIFLELTTFVNDIEHRHSHGTCSTHYFLFKKENFTISNRLCLSKHEIIDRVIFKSIVYLTPSNILSHYIRTISAGRVFIDIIQVENSILVTTLRICALHPAIVNIYITGSIRGKSL